MFGCLGLRHASVVMFVHSETRKPLPKNEFPSGLILTFLVLGTYRNLCPARNSKAATEIQFLTAVDEFLDAWKV